MDGMSISSKRPRISIISDMRNTNLTATPVDLLLDDGRPSAKYIVRIYLRKTVS